MYKNISERISQSISGICIFRFKQLISCIWELAGIFLCFASALCIFWVNLYRAGCASRQSDVSLTEGAFQENVFQIIIFRKFYQKRKSIKVESVIPGRGFRKTVTYSRWQSCGVLPVCGKDTGTGKAAFVTGCGINFLK